MVVRVRICWQLADTASKFRSQRHVRTWIRLVGKASYGSVMDAKTEELRAAHDVLAEFHADRLPGAGRAAAPTLASNSTSTGCRRMRWNAGWSTPASRPCSGAAAPPRARRVPRRGICSLRCA